MGLSPNCPKGKKGTDFFIDLRRKEKMLEIREKYRKKKARINTRTN